MTIDLPPLPQGTWRSSTIYSPKQAEYRASLGSPMAKPAAPLMLNVPLAPVPGFVITNLTISGSQVTISWQGTGTTFQVQGSADLLNWSPVAEVAGMSATFPLSTNHFWKVRELVTAPGQVLWGQNIGGGLADLLYDVSVSPDGSLWGVGSSSSGPVCRLVKCNPDGSNGFINDYYSNPVGGVIRAIAFDSLGNAWVTGYFGDTLDLGNGHVLTAKSTTPAPYGSLDIFVAKFDSSGACQFARNWGTDGQSNTGQQNPQGGFGIALDNSGHVLVVGKVYGSSIDFGNGFSFVVNNNGPLVVLKLDAATGNTVWAFVIAKESSSGGWGKCVAVDASDNVYVGGQINTFNGPVDLKGVSGSSVLVSNSGVAALLAKYNSAGALQWYRAFGPNLGVQITAVNRVLIDSAGNPVICGDWAGTIDAGGGSISSANQTVYKDGFVIKYDGQSGNYLWGYYPALQVITPLGMLGMATDRDDNVIIAGAFNQGCNFTRTPTSAGDALAAMSPTNGHVFAVKYSKDGSFSWGQNDGAASLTDYGTCAAADLKTGTIYYGGTAFDPVAMHNPAPGFNNGTAIGTVTTLQNNGNRDWFVIRMNK